MCLRFNTVTPVAAEYFDERFGSNGRQLAQLLHFCMALRALADIADLFDHSAMMWMKSAGKMKVGPRKTTEKEGRSYVAESGLSGSRTDVIAAIAAEYPRWMASKATKDQSMLPRLTHCSQAARSRQEWLKNEWGRQGSLAVPQGTSNQFRVTGVHAFPTQTVSIVPAHESIDHASAGRTDRQEHHFFVASRTIWENRWDAVGRYTCSGHVHTPYCPFAGLACPTGGCEISFVAERNTE